MLNYNPIKVTKYEDYNVLREAVEVEDDVTSYVPVPHFLTFKDDKWINNQWTFNENGLKSLLSATGIYGLFSAMNASEEPTQASNYLNRIMLQEDIKKKFDNKRLVVSDGEVIGIVGSRYNPYSNRQFLDDLPIKDMNMTRAVISNSKMTVSFTELFNGFHLRGGDDRTEIGQTFKNSWVGDSSLKSFIWTLRTVCTNGMMHRSDVSNMRAYHTGSFGSMKTKLDEIIELAKDQYKVIKGRIETLLEIPYTKDTADRLLWNKAPINIISDLKEKKLWNTDKKFNDAEESLEDLKRSIAIVDHIPMRYGGEHTHRIWNSSFREKRSMYDFVEAFTEHAQTCDPQTQIEIEEDAGHLTSWIAKHKEKLLN
tara:strand:+ start:390 stop:1493 length:1104 start_codon:yes stop_codon:yes gene_type:complete